MTACGFQQWIWKKRSSIEGRDQMTVRCYCEECVHNDDGYCGEVIIYISSEEMTAAGMIPQCTDYEERRDG